MKSRSTHFYLYIPILVILLITGCDPVILQPIDDSSPKINSEKSVSKSIKDTAILTQNVVPMRPQNCANGGNLVYKYSWEAQNLYRPVAGKYVGVMDDGDMSRNHNYYTQSGCRTVLVNDPSLIAQLHSYGYSLDSIFVGLNPSNWAQTVNLAVSQGVKRFYIDEPIRMGYQQFVRDASPYIATFGGTLTISESEFNYYDWYVIGDKGNIEDMVNLALEVNPHPFVCCHTHFEYHWVLGVKFTMDPRDQWSYIMSRVPNLFKMAIIKSRQTGDEIDLLVGHANNIGLNQILLYPFNSDGIGYAGVQTAIGVAQTEHWLQELLKEIREEWCCPTIEWYPNECSFKTEYYTGSIQWN